MVVVDACVPHPGDVPSKIASNKLIVPVKLVLYPADNPVVLSRVLEHPARRLRTPPLVRRHPVAVCLHLPGKLVVHVEAKLLVVVENVSLDLAVRHELIADHAHGHAHWTTVRLTAAQGPEAMLMPNDSVVQDIVGHPKEEQPSRFLTRASLLLPFYPTSCDADISKLSNPLARSLSIVHNRADDDIVAECVVHLISILHVDAHTLFSNAGQQNS